MSAMPIPSVQRPIRLNSAEEQGEKSPKLPRGSLFTEMKVGDGVSLGSIEGQACAIPRPAA